MAGNRNTYLFGAGLGALIGGARSFAFGGDPLSGAVAGAGFGTGVAARRDILTMRGEDGVVARGVLRGMGGGGYGHGGYGGYAPAAYRPMMYSAGQPIISPSESIAVMDMVGTGTVVDMAQPDMGLLRSPREFWRGWLEYFWVGRGLFLRQGHLFMSRTEGLLVTEKFRGMLHLPQRFMPSKPLLNPHKHQLLECKGRRM